MVSLIRQYSLTTIIGMVITGFSVFTALLVGFLMHLNYDHRLTEEFHKKVQANGHQIGFAFANHLSVIKRRLSELAHDNSIRVTMMLEVDYQLEERLKTYHGQPPGTTFFLVHEGDSQILSSGRDQQSSERLFAAIVNSAVAAGTFVRSDEGSFLVGFAMPIMKRVRQLGTAGSVYSFELSAFSSDILDPEKGNRIVIKDQHGFWDLTTGQFVEIEHTNSRPEAEEGFFHASVDGIPGVFAQVGGFPGLSYFVPLASLDQARYESLLIAIILSLGVAAASFAVAMVLARWIGSPLRELAVSARRLADGRATPAGISKRYNITELDQFASSLMEIVYNLKQAEELKRYQVLFDGLGEPVCIIGRQGNIVEANEIAPAFFGMKRAEFLQRKVFEFIPERLRDEFRSVLLSVWQDGAEMTYEGKCTAGSGQVIDTEYRVRQIEYDGRPVILIVIIDMTERMRAERELRESERRFRTFIDATPSAILIKDVDGRILIANKCWHEWFNPHGKDISGKTSFDFYPEDHANEILAQDREALETGAIVECEHETPLAGGSRRSTLMQKFPIFDVNGAVLAIGGINHDITQKKQTEENLRQTVAEADYANRAKSEFLANMSHELRTPLNAIIGFSEMISGETFGPIGSPKYIEYVKDIHDSGTLLLELINDILDLSKIEAGKLDLHEKRVDVAKVVRSCLRIVKQRAEEVGVRVALIAANGLPDIWADERAIKQIVLNLLSNAIRVTGESGCIEVEVRNDGDRSLTLTVADTGVGIAASDIRKVLEPFGQIENPMTCNQNGIGLGLPLVKSLTELHDGELTIASQVGVGTAISVRFPAARVLGHPAESEVKALSV